ncbi:MAG: riboflavin biosynthesis protein RibF [candidate division WOR-3 bacterium]
MLIYNLAPNKSYPDYFSSIITIGSFDGIHRGHDKIIKETKKLAKQKGKPWGIITFSPTPQVLLYRDFRFLLTTDEEKWIILEKYSPSFVGIIKFTRKIQNLMPEGFFVNYIVKPLRPQLVVVGPDHRFGKNSSGDIKLLKKLELKYKFTVKILRHYKYHRIPIQSTRIRELLILGNIKRANELLGRYYSLIGTIKAGHGIARKLGFPTINIQIKNKYKLIPPDGVYFIRAGLLNKIYYGVMHIGISPTVSELFRVPKRRKIEVYLLNYRANEKINLYGQKISLEIIDRLREERKFSNTEDLQKQIAKDVSQAYKLIYG